MHGIKGMTHLGTLCLGGKSNTAGVLMTQDEEESVIHFNFLSVPPDFNASAAVVAAA